MSEVVSARPRKKFDREYATEWRKERDWLAERGFVPTYVKRVGDGIERYKYRKSAELFANLELFYRLQEETRAAMVAEAISDGDYDDMDATLKIDTSWEDDTL